MTRYFRSSAVALAVAAAACGKDKNEKVATVPTVDALAQDTSLQLAPTPTGDQYLGPQDIMRVAAPAAAAAGTSTSSKPASPKSSNRATLASQPAVRSTRSSRASRRIVRTTTRVRDASRSRRVAQSSGKSTGSTRRARTNARTSAPSDIVSAESVASSVGPAQTQSSRSSSTRRAHAFISSGSELTLASSPKVCTNKASVGDRFETHLVNDVVGSNGAIIPKGATATAVISSVAPRSRDANDLGMGLEIESVSFSGHTYPVSSRVTSAQFDKVRSSSRGSDLAKIATGTLLGAGVGRVAGRNTRSTVIGAVGGAAAGAVVASQSGNVNKCVPSGGLITARLVEPLEIASAD
ncbi:MAG TPA: hypothetical protein VM099_05240 [Gemmatimonadaceae bacterium]|nr:hypothetical protein [Gemmatimonadaceae bacterium]